MRKYHDLYVQLNTILLSDIYENFRDVCLGIYQLDPTHFLSSPGLAWKACLKKTKVKLELLTDRDMLLMFEEGIRGGICQTIHRYETANNKYMKNKYNKEVKSSFLQYLDANNLYRLSMCKKLPIGKFKWAKNLSIHTEDAIKSYDENSDYGAILEVGVEYPIKKQMKHEHLAFLPEQTKINGIEKLVTT